MKNQNEKKITININVDKLIDKVVIINANDKSNIENLEKLIRIALLKAIHDTESDLNQSPEIPE